MEKSAPITGQSRFNIGSACKEIPGLAILELIEQGKLDYKDKVDRFLDYLPDWAGRITIEDLLFYRSGLPPIDFRSSNNDENTVKDLQKVDQLQKRMDGCCDDECGPVEADGADPEGNSGHSGSH